MAIAQFLEKHPKALSTLIKIRNPNNSRHLKA